MDRIRIVGGRKLNGTIPISGAKNAALPLMIAGLLTDETLILDNVPRLADAPFSMECKTWKEIDVNGDRLLVMGEGIHFHIRDELWDHAAMRVHMDRYHPIGRMFADRYCRTDDRVEFPAAPVVAAKAAE